MKIFLSIIMFLSVFCNIYGLTGTVWMGENIIFSDETNEKKHVNITMTFLNERIVQLLEWETTVLDLEYNHKYEYTMVNNNIILYPYYVSDMDPNEERIEYSATIEGNTMIFPEWLNGERFVFHKRTDLSTDGDIIIISDIYFKNTEYFIVMECKLLSNDYADIYLYATSDKIDYGIGLNIAGRSSVAAVEGYNKIICTFTKDEVIQHETDEFRKLHFIHTDTGSSTEQERREYVERNGYPPLTDIWASMRYAGDFLANSEKKKFR